MTEPPQTAERRDDDRGPLARLPRLDIAYKTPPSSSPDDDALRGARRRCCRAAAARASTRRSSGRSSWPPTCSRVGGESRGPGSVQRRRHGGAGQERRGPRGGDRRRDREGESGADRRLGDREGAQQRARASSSTSLGSSLAAGDQLGEYALFYNNPDRINTRADNIAKVTARRRAARREAVPGQDRPDVS